MPRARLNLNQWSILGLAAAALSSAASSLYTVTHIQNQTIALAATGQSLAPGQFAGVLGPPDYTLAATAFCVFLLLLIGEWRVKAFSKLLRTATSIQNFWVLTISGSWLGIAICFDLGPFCHPGMRRVGWSIARGENSTVSTRRAECPRTWTPARA